MIWKTPIYQNPVVLKIAHCVWDWAGQVGKEYGFVETLMNDTQVLLAFGKNGKIHYNKHQVDIFENVYMKCQIN